MEIQDLIGKLCSYSGNFKGLRYGIIVYAESLNIGFNTNPFIYIGDVDSINNPYSSIANNKEIHYKDLVSINDIIDVYAVCAE